MRTRFIALCLFTMLPVLGASDLPAAGQAVPPQAELPVLLTSCGQSPGANMLKAIFMRAIKQDPPAYTLIMEATPEDLNQAAAAGRPFKSLIIVMGASLKGMGAAGISMDDELERTAQLIEAARASGITVIGAHIEGMKRRAQGAAAGDNTDELSIDAVAPNSDFLIINQDGDSDKRFTTIANEKQLAMLTVTKNLELLEVVTKIFGR